MKSFALIIVLTFGIQSSSAANGIDPVSLLLEAPTAAKLVAEYLGLVESLDSKIDRLLDADLKTAVSLFEQAKENPKKADKLIGDARLYFTRAAAIEAESMDEVRRHKRAIALLGLWSCCEAENDKPNATLALKKITEIPSEPSFAMKAKYHGSILAAAVAPNFDIPFAFAFAYRSWTRKPPTNNDWRQFNKDYDSLLTIQAAAKKKLEPKQK